MHKHLAGLSFALFALLVAPDARAQDATPSDQGQTAAQGQVAAQGQTARTQAIDYSHGYEVRAKIHKYGSYATLPLLGTEVALGTSLYDDPRSHTSSKRSAHIAVGTAITGLFAVNTVTGVWNLVESRKDPSHRTLRLVHGLLMLGADAGFVAAFGTGPSGEHLVNFDNNKGTHRAIALTSIGVATGGYLIMLFGNK
jgi:hypothetical protein